MAGIYGIGVSALKVAQAGISVTTHNIANVNTPGYSRQGVTQAAMLPQNTGSGFFGQGADITSVVRNYDEFLNAQLVEAQTTSSNLNTQLGLAQQVSNLLGDTNGGLTTALQDFFSSVSGVANAPESVAARQNMLGGAQSLTNRLQSVDARLGEIRSSLNGQIGNSTTLINSYAKQIASLNNNISYAQAQNPGQLPNDLLDQRDQLINQLSQEIRVSSIKQPDGSTDVFIGSGQSLVIGSRYSTLQATTSATDPTALEVALLNDKGLNRIQQSALQGGNLGAYLSFRSTVLDPAQNAVGRIAVGLATGINQQHKQGVDLNGALGGNLFSAGVPQVAAATTNTGNATLSVTINSASALTGRDYSVQFDGTSYTVFDTTTNTAVQSFTAATLATAQTVTGTGLTLQVTAGSVANVAGDSYLIRPTVNGAKNFALSITDPTKIAAANPIRANAPIANVGTGAIIQPAINPIVTPKAGNAGVLSAPAATAYPLNANIQEPITLTFLSATTYTATGVGAPTGVQTVTAAVAPATTPTISINGWTTSVTTNPVAGDSFSIGPGLDANLRQAITLTFTSPTSYTVTGTGAPVGAQTFTSGAAININGWSTQINGTPAAGDTFTIATNTNASTDATNVLKLAQLQTTNTLANGTTSYQGAYGQLVAQVGSQTRELDVTSRAQTTMLAQVTKSQQSISGVNLDEEAANLLKYQQAYQAAAKAMSISQAMFDSLLTLGK